MITLQQIQDAAAASGLPLSDHDGLASYMSYGRTRVDLVPISAIQAYLQSEGLWWSMKDIDYTHPAYPAVLAVFDVSAARYDNIDTTLPIVSQILGSLVSASVITQAQMDHITGLGIVPDPVTPLEIARILEGVA